MKNHLKQHINSIHEEKIIINVIFFILGLEKYEKYMTTIHEDKKSLKCQFCDFNGNMKNHLKQHNNSIHEEKISKKCDCCETNSWKVWKNAWPQFMKVNSD